MSFDIKEPFNTALGRCLFRIDFVTLYLNDDDVHKLAHAYIE